MARTSIILILYYTSRTYAWKGRRKTSYKAAQHRNMSKDDTWGPDELEKWEGLWLDCELRHFSVVGVGGEIGTTCLSGWDGLAQIIPIWSPLCCLLVHDRVWHRVEDAANVIRLHSFLNHFICGRILLILEIRVFEYLNFRNNNGLMTRLPFVCASCLELDAVFYWLEKSAINLFCCVLLHSPSSYYDQQKLACHINQVETQSAEFIP